MSALENVWVVGLLAILFLTLWGFIRLRRRTADFHQSQLAKARLPAWIAQFETLLFSALIVGLMIGVAGVYFRILVPLLKVHPAKTGASAIYFGLGAVMIAIPTGLLCANLVSWLIPPVRKVNLQAMDGLDVSFWSANRGLFLAGAAMIPVGVVLLGLSLIEPWRA